ncbi:hypothetical protein HMSSN036_27440 [Paenibacillus macerans]|nr:hypothetical protein HMSSN036_27440 [Paenibacillus macerans]
MLLSVIPGKTKRWKGSDTTSSSIPGKAVHAAGTNRSSGERRTMEYNGVMHPQIKGIAAMKQIPVISGFSTSINKPPKK